MRQVPGRLVVAALAALAALSAAAVLTTPREGRLNGQPCILNAAIGTRITENHRHFTVFQGSIVQLKPPVAYPFPIVDTSDPSVLRRVLACPDAAGPAYEPAATFAADKAGRATLSTNYLDGAPFAFLGYQPPVKTFDATVTVLPDPRPFAAAIAIIGLVAFGLVRRLKVKPKA